MDDEIQDTVESILGKGVKVVDCQKTSSIKEEEVLLVNGIPVPLEGEDGAAIRNALIHGVVPDCDLLNQLLIRAGILKSPVRLETSLSVKSSVVTREEVTVAKGGQVIDERSRETKEDNYYTSNSSEIWEPVGMVPLKGKGSIKVIEGPAPGYGSYSSCSSEPSTSADSAFCPSGQQSFTSSAPNRTQSSTSTDSANSSARDFLSPAAAMRNSGARTTMSGRAGSPYNDEVDCAGAYANGMQSLHITEVPTYSSAKVSVNLFLGLSTDF